MIRWDIYLSKFVKIFQKFLRKTINISLKNISVTNIYRVIVPLYKFSKMKLSWFLRFRVGGRNVFQVDAPPTILIYVIHKFHLVINSVNFNQLTRQQYFNTGIFPLVNNPYAMLKGRVGGGGKTINNHKYL